MLDYLAHTANRKPDKTGVNGSNPLSPTIDTRVAIPHNDPLGTLSLCQVLAITMGKAELFPYRPVELGLRYRTKKTPQRSHTLCRPLRKAPGGAPAISGIGQSTPSP